MDYFCAQSRKYSWTCTGVPRDERKAFGGQLRSWSEHGVTEAEVRAIIDAFFRDLRTKPKTYSGSVWRLFVKQRARAAELAGRRVKESVRDANAPEAIQRSERELLARARNKRIEP